MVKGQPVLRQGLNVGRMRAVAIKLKVVDGVILRNKKDHIGPLGRLRTAGQSQKCAQRKNQFTHENGFGAIEPLNE